jgi:hypothetical protein
MLGLPWQATGGFVMATAKEQMARIIQGQPEDSSYDELLRELAFVRMVERGLRDSTEAKTIGNEEMLLRMRSWQR